MEEGSRGVPLGTLIALMVEEGEAKASRPETVGNPDLGEVRWRSLVGVSHNPKAPPLPTHTIGLSFTYYRMIDKKAHR